MSDDNSTTMDIRTKRNFSSRSYKFGELPNLLSREITGAPKDKNN